MLDNQDLLFKLKNKKNLLAFSSGVDSSALFFLLLDKNIKFDIAIVNYNTRENSLKEVQYAKDLANKYNKNCYIKEVKLEKSNFEKNARDIRYKFFEKLIQEYEYENLLLAHQLNDMLEWFFMQMFKGAGIRELIGMKECERKDILDSNFMLIKSYNTIRPILQISKDELLNYLNKNNHKYFLDSSNFDKKYTRNKIRIELSNEIIKEYKEGIKNTFKYINQDLQFFPKVKLLSQNKKYFIYENNENNIYKILDYAFKKIGILLSKSQKDEIVNTKDCIVGKDIAVFVDDKIHIAPYVKIVLDKKIREKYRLNKIPPKIRGYFYKYLEE